MTNDASFTLESASGGQAVLEPSNTSQPIIDTYSPTDPHFTMEGLEFTGETSNVAVLIYSYDSGAAVTFDDDLFSGDGTDGSFLGGGVFLADGGSSSSEVSSFVGDTFTHDAANAGGGMVISSTESVVVSGNTFTADTAATAGGGLFMFPATSGTPTTAPVEVSNNVFGGSSVAEGNSAVEGGGAAITLNTGQPLTLSSNVFEHDTTAGAVVPNAYPDTQADGAGLFLGTAYGDGPFPVTQSHNTFLDDVDASTQSTGRYGGGGEWVQGLTVQSTDDRFTDDEVTGGGGGIPGGGGLGAIDSAAEESEGALPATFIGRNDLFSGDSVTAAGGWGGGVYVGYGDETGPPCTGTCPGSSLTLLDSTLVDNTVTGSGGQGGAIWGDDYDNLTLENSIVYGNSPQPEIWGFTSTKPSFGYDDACSESGGPTITGSGDICADPKLGSGATETTESPTVDAGSNALVPTGLTTDLAGKPRIVANRVASCAGPKLDAARVDMGAFEATFKVPPTCSAKVQIGSGALTDKGGETNVNLSCPDGYEFCAGTVTLTTSETFQPTQAGTEAGRATKLKLGSASFKLGYSKAGIVRVKLSKSAVAELTRRGQRSVKVVIAGSDHDAQNDRASSSSNTTLTLPAAKKHPRKTHPRKKHRRPKHRRKSRPRFTG